MTKPGAGLLAICVLTLTANPVAAQSKSSNDTLIPAALHCAAHQALPVSPEEYTRLHSRILSAEEKAASRRLDLGIGFDPASTGEPLSFQEAVNRLADVGDEFTLSLLPGIQEIHSKHEPALTNAAQRIRERLAVPSKEPAEGIVRARLERAAYADVTCSPVEGLLVRWTLDRVRKMMKDPEVSRAVARLSEAKPKEDPADVWRHFTAQRVQSYAIGLLKP